jgi:hypothetical protein
LPKRKKLNLAKPRVELENVSLSSGDGEEDVTTPVLLGEERGRDGGLSGRAGLLDEVGGETQERRARR